MKLALLHSILRLKHVWIKLPCIFLRDSSLHDITKDYVHCVGIGSGVNNLRILALDERSWTMVLILEDLNKSYHKELLWLASFLNKATKTKLSSFSLNWGQRLIFWDSGSISLILLTTRAPVVTTLAATRRGSFLLMSIFRRELMPFAWSMFASVTKWSDLRVPQFYALSSGLRMTKCQDSQLSDPHLTQSHPPMFDFWQLWTPCLQVYQLHLWWIVSFWSNRKLYLLIFHIINSRSW